MSIEPCIPTQLLVELVRIFGVLSFATQAASNLEAYFWSLFLQKHANLILDFLCALQEQGIFDSLSSNGKI